jgi:hypothetical protein
MFYSASLLKQKILIKLRFHAVNRFLMSILVRKLSVTPVFGYLNDKTSVTSYTSLEIVKSPENSTIESNTLMSVP